MLWYSYSILVSVYTVSLMHIVLCYFVMVKVIFRCIFCSFHLTICSALHAWHIGALTSSDELRVLPLMFTLALNRRLKR